MSAPDLTRLRHRADGPPELVTDYAASRAIAAEMLARERAALSRRPWWQIFGRNDNA